MILPTKKLNPENSLIHLGGKVLAVLDEPKTVSRAWEEFKSARKVDTYRTSGAVPYDWFVLALDLLFTTGAVDLVDGRLRRKDAV